MVKRVDILKKIRPFIGKDIIKVITGIRRCGKSVLLGQIRDLIARAYVTATFRIFWRKELSGSENCITEREHDGFKWECGRLGG